MCVQEQKITTKWFDVLSAVGETLIWNEENVLIEVSIMFSSINWAGNFNKQTLVSFELKFSFAVPPKHTIDLEDQVLILVLLYQHDHAPSLFSSEVHDYVNNSYAERE